MKILSSKEKLILIGFSLAGIFLVSKAIFSSPEDFDHRFGLCMFKNITGLDCPGCGLSRSFIFLLKGDFSRSISYHLLGIPVFISFGIFYFQTFTGLFFHRTFVRFSFFKNQKFIFLAVFLFSAVYAGKLYGMGKERIASDLQKGIGWTIIEFLAETRPESKEIQ